MKSLEELEAAFNDLSDEVKALKTANVAGDTAPLTDRINKIETCLTVAIGEKATATIMETGKLPE